MPRLSTHRYLQIHHQLKDLWINHIGQFAELSSRDQYNLHGYFQITSDKPDDILLRNRAELTKHYPSLPHQAGKAFKLLDSIPLPEASRTPIVKGKRRKPGQPQVISVRSVVRPKPDVRKLARAFQAWYADTDSISKES